MTNIAMEVPSRSWNLGSVADRVGAFHTILLGRYHRWRQYRTTMAELDQYSAEQLAELAIAPADVARIAKEAAGS